HAAQRRSALRAASGTWLASPREIEAFSCFEGSVTVDVYKDEWLFAVRRLDQQRLDASSTRRSVHRKPTGEDLRARWNPQIRWHCREPGADGRCQALRADTR